MEILLAELQGKNLDERGYLVDLEDREEWVVWKLIRKKGVHRKGSAHDPLCSTPPLPGETYYNHTENVSSISLAEIEVC